MKSNKHTRLFYLSLDTEGFRSHLGHIVKLFSAAISVSNAILQKQDGSIHTFTRSLELELEEPAVTKGLGMASAAEKWSSLQTPVS